MSTKHFVVEYQEREVKGNSVRKLRRSGLLPAVVYGRQMKPISISLPFTSFVKTYRNAGKTSVIDLSNGSKKMPCLVHDLDFDPVKDVIRHVDFLFVDLNQKTHAEVPLKYINEPSKESDGVLVRQLNSVEIEALPDEIPHEIEVDLSLLKEVGDIIRVENLNIPSVVTLITDKQEVVALLASQEEEKEDEPISMVETSPDSTEAPTPVSESTN